MNKTILIVEDEFTIRKPLAIKFQEEGFEVMEAADGEQALKLALEKHPDIILLDLLMPVMDGTTTLKKLREDFWGSTVKVIILTNVNNMDKIAEAAEYGASEYIIKSDIKLKEMVERVKERLS